MTVMTIMTMTNPSFAYIPEMLVEVYREKFLNREDVWFKQYVSNQKCEYFAVKSESGHSEISKVIRSHLQGELTAAWAAIDRDNKSRWCCWDSDLDADFLSKISELLDSWSFASIAEGRRDGREGHLWLFFDSPVSCMELLRFNKEVLAQCQIPADVIEFFPKYADKFSQVRGPLGVHRKPGANNQRGWFNEEEPSLIQQLEYLAAVPMNAGWKISNIAKACFAIDKRLSAIAPATPNQERCARLPNAFDILALIPEHARRLRGNDWETQCPLCAAEGGDNHGDNLHIHRSGSPFTCVKDGPGKRHSAPQIAAALSRS